MPPADGAAVPGMVYLVGAGPGDPDLLTLRAARLLATCHLVAYDRLVTREILDLVADHAERLCVGKRRGKPGWSQEEINRLLVDTARAGRAVVRLKGGDPFVFGRGGEEALACAAAGVPFEVVPGVTSAVAGPAAAGIPITHRGLSTGFAVVTGSEDPHKSVVRVDYAALAAFPGTLVFLMGVASVRQIAAQLVSHGRDPATPVALVRWATTAQQEVLEGDLATIADAVERSGFAPPAVIVVGEVVALRRVLAAASSPRDLLQALPAV